MCTPNIFYESLHTLPYFSPWRGRKKRVNLVDEWLNGEGKIHFIIANKLNNKSIFPATLIFTLSFVSLLFREAWKTEINGWKSEPKRSSNSSFLRGRWDAIYFASLRTTTKSFVESIRNKYGAGTRAWKISDLIFSITLNWFGKQCVPFSPLPVPSSEIYF